MNANPRNQQKELAVPPSRKPLSFRQWCEFVYDPVLRPSVNIRRKMEPVEWGGRIWTDRDLT